MLPKLLRSKNVHALLIAYVMVAAGLLFLVQAHTAAAAATRDTLVVGLQNDMVNPNYFDTATNSVWKQYQVEFNFEGLITHDPDFTSYNVLSDPSVTTCPTGSVVPSWVPGGICIDTATGKTATVYLRNNVTFTNGQPLTADDVVFTFQHLPWSTYQLSVFNAIWWDVPKWPLWNSTANGGTCAAAKCVSHVGVEKVSTYVVRFDLAQTYALFQYDTLEVPIIPSGLWSSHLAAWPQLNLSNPSQTLTDSYDTSIDTSWNNVLASTGTGPFALTSWVHNSGATIDIYPSYWGQGQTHLWRNDQYPFYPKAVRHIVTHIYGSLDVVSLALQKGDIDTLVWSLTPGFVTQIQSNPAISIAQVTDSGYFYMAYNLREKPWGQASYSLTLRTAMSMAIDKDYIVNTLMGGFGIKGTVPIGISNPLYVNTSASPPAFNIAAGHALLVGAGFADINGDGFLEAPDGTPIKATILTPPKDYDPVRADAGIMISNNLKAMGLDIDAAPTSFDTIVAKAFVAPVSFDIYILGWSLGDFPETYICSFFCTNQDVNLNTGGSNSPGYSNTKVDSLIASAVTDTDPVSRVQKIKDVEGIVVHDLPWEVLYYRKNLNAYRNDAWVGWANYPNGGGLYNPWSISHIVPATAVIPPPPSGSLTVALSMPDQVYARENVAINVAVSQGSAPASGAAVSVNLTYGSTSVVLTGTTDATGFASFSWTVPVIQGNVLATVVATKGTLTGTNGKVMEVTIGPPAPMAQLTLSTPTPVIAPTGTATITATLTDGTGAAIAGRTVTIDSTLVLGTISPTTATTDANGHALFTYTPPATTKFPNQHLSEVIKANTTVPNTIVGDIQHASLIVFVQNDANPDWMIVSAAPVLGAVDFTVSPGKPTSDFTVSVKNWAGSPVVGKDVEAVFTDTNNISVAATTAGSNKTNAAGLANFTVTRTGAAANNTNVLLRFDVRNEPTSTADEFALLVWNGSATGQYAAYLTFDARTMAFASAGATNNVHAHVYNPAGVPVSGVPVMFQVDYGPLGLPAEFDWAYDYATSTYGGAGLDLNSFAQGSVGGAFAHSPVIGDPTVGTKWGVENFVEDFEVVGNIGVVDSCDPTTWPAGFGGLYYINATGATDATGVYSAHFTAMPHRIDSKIQVRAYIGGAPTVVADACNFVSSVENYAFRIDSGVVSQRAPVFAMSSFSLSRPILTSQALTVTISGKFVGLNGAIANPQLILVQGAGSAARNVRGAFGGPLTGTSLGFVNYTRTVSLLSLSQSFSFAFIPADSRYAYGGTDQMFTGAFGIYWFGPTFAALLSKIPFEFKVGYLYLPTSTAFLTVSLGSALLPPGGTTTATVHVYSILTGLPLAGANVWSGSTQNTTDANGVATLQVTATSLGATEGLVVATTAYGGAARGWYATIATPPVVTYGAPTVDAKTAGTASTITATVTNTLPLAGSTTVWLYVDNSSVASKVVNLTASGSATVTFSYVFPTSGSHYVTVGTQSTTATIPAAAGPAAQDQTLLYGLAVGLLVVGLVVGVLVGMMMSRRGKKPPMPEESSEDKAEEELPPEDKL